VWADSVVHLLLDGIRLKTVPSRLSRAQLQQLLADGGRPAGVHSASWIGSGDQSNGWFEMGASVGFWAARPAAQRGHAPPGRAQLGP